MFERSESVASNTSNAQVPSLHLQNFRKFESVETWPLTGEVFLHPFRKMCVGT